MKRTTSPTIKEVAQVAGVSIATVSYVINDGPRAVNAETRERVLQAMAQVGYHPNISARRLRRQRTGILGLVIAGSSGLHALADPYFLDVMRGVGESADRARYDLLLLSNTQQVQTPEFYQRLAGQRMVDGLIISGSLINPEGLAFMATAPLPTVVVGRQLGVFGLSRVTFDYQESTRLLAAHLIGQGHTRIGLLLNMAALDSEPQRLAGYQQALDAAGLPFDAALVWSPTAFETAAPVEVLGGLIERGVTALISDAFSELCARLDTLDAADVVVATLDDRPYLARPARLVAGVRLPKEQAGAEAVERLVHLIDDAPQDSTERVLACELVAYSP